MANISNNVNVHDGAAVGNWISQIHAGNATYDIATHHKITFKDGSTDTKGVTWNGLTDLEVIIPSKIKEKDNSTVIKPFPLLFNSSILSGIKSIIDTHNITPDAKERLAAITLFSFLRLIKIGIKPNNVERPAKEVRKKARKVVFMLSPINYMKMKEELIHQ